MFSYKREYFQFNLQVGEVGQAAQALVQEVQAGESDQPLVGTAKSQRVEVDRVAGKMDPTTREATATPVTPGAITLTKKTGNLSLNWEILMVFLFHFLYFLQTLLCISTL